MEPVLLYGVPAGCSLASIIALEWLGKPYKLCRIEMLRHPWPQAYARLNPRMKTPALLSASGGSLTESAAILQHIAAQGIDAGLGFRQGTVECDRLSEMLAYLTTDFFAAYAPLWKAYEVQGLGEHERQRLRDEGTVLVRKEFGHVERMLDGRHWLLGGSGPTVADAYLFAVGRWADYHQVVDVAAAFPSIASHKARLLRDPAVQLALAVEDGAAVEPTAAFKGHVSLEHITAPLQALSN